MMPSAPGLLSITTVWPSDCDIAAATIRAVTSVVPPVPNATTARTGFAGYWACASRGAASSAASSIFFMRKAFINGIPSALLGRMRMGAAYRRRDDLVRDVKVPDRGAAACGELSHELRQIVQVPDRLSREPESARDAGEIAVSEHRSVLGHSFRAQLVQLGSVRAIVHHDDQDVQPMAPDRLELLHVHHQTAVAVEQHDGAIRARRRHADRERDAVADGAELADRQELLLRARRHLRKEPGAVAARVHHLPVVRQALFERF